MRFLRILHLTDVHIDFGEDESRRRIMDLLEESFDVVACTGDIANGRRALRRFLSWFQDDERPRFLVPGNHDLWATKTVDWFCHDARKYGWRTFTDPRAPWEVVDDVLLVNLWYTTEPAWAAWNGNDYRSTLDHARFRVEEQFQNPRIPDEAPRVRFSMGHLQPTDLLPLPFDPNVMFVNNRHLPLLHAHRSPLHLFGHTHLPVDMTLRGIRFVNAPFRGPDYQVRTHCPVIRL